MNARLAALAGGVVVAAAGLLKVLRRGASFPVESPPGDPRADELRRKLAESRSVVGEQDEFETAETPIDTVEPVGEDVDERRRSLHERGRAAVDEMRGVNGE
ncbi:MAG: hypothetical protein M3229_04235 [Actinomycetota bacterium]|nr:hypothetical protein [Actinomycetota bacterium]